MYRIGNFEKVDYKEFKESMNGVFKNDYDLKDIYESIQLPKRATKGSAGYDFFSPFDIRIKPYQTVKIITGIRVKIKRGWFLALYPRSSLGHKYRLQFDNTICIFDSDYYYSDNQGHILVQITNDSKIGKEVFLPKGSKFMQGILQPYGITYDDDVITLRNGGIGSTD